MKTSTIFGVMSLILNVFLLAVIGWMLSRGPRYEPYAYRNVDFEGKGYTVRTNQQSGELQWFYGPRGWVTIGHPDLLPGQKDVFDQLAATRPAP